MKQPNRNICLAAFVACLAAGTKAATSRERRLPIVVIGASTGGLAPLGEFFTPLPKDTGMAFVVVAHQHAGHTSLLPELLGRVAPIKVVPAQFKLVTDDRGQPDAICLLGNHPASESPS